uniref:Uncharacterized protein n=1 Tax=Rhizophora mucronata TaxID=61149 RepID=A0A2P2P9H5_RHIMU
MFLNIADLTILLLYNFS